MFCGECGNQLYEGDAYCTICGAPINRVEQQGIPSQNNGGLVTEYSNNINSQEMYNYVNNVANSNVSNKKTGKRKSSKLIIVAIVLCIVAFSVVLVLRLPGNLLSPQRKVIDEYFEAINNTDVDDILEISYTDEVLEIKSEYDPGDLYFFTNYSFMGFKRGLFEFDVFRVIPCIYETYPNKMDGLTEEQVTKKTLRMLEVSYDVIDIKSLDDFELKVISSPSGVNSSDEPMTLDDLEKLVNYTDFKTGEKTNLKVDDAYVAQVKVKWFYDDMLYGIDKSWWKDDEFKEDVERYGQDDFATYDDAVSFMETLNGKEQVYLLVLYKCDDEWYILKGDRLGSLTSVYEKEKGILNLYH